MHGCGIARFPCHITALLLSVSLLRTWRCISYNRSVSASFCARSIDKNFYYRATEMPTEKWSTTQYKTLLQNKILHQQYLEGGPEKNAQLGGLNESTALNVVPYGLILLWFVTAWRCKHSFCHKIALKMWHVYWCFWISHLPAAAQRIFNCIV